MPAQRKYPDELRERAVKMVFEVRERDGKGTGRLPGWRRSWVFTVRCCGPGFGRRKSMAVSGRAPRPGISSGSWSWKENCANPAVPMRY
jgi:hypothetical protein